jgi:hypothetical protein
VTLVEVRRAERVEAGVTPAMSAARSASWPAPCAAAAIPRPIMAAADSITSPMAFADSLKVGAVCRDRRGSVAIDSLLLEANRIIRWLVNSLRESCH